ncbi:MAG: hypothetical protein ACTFAL_09205 [Candidatus Electronema sp. V4]|uniref:hypothetical protein n=1 Tax=Candidatus Electronema sp. V4 TaxID=3454756 RepID=UPI0040558DE3
MKDSELRGYILQYFYDRRRNGLTLSPPKPADIGVEVTEQDILYVCDQLGEHNYLEWNGRKFNYKSSGKILSGYGRINAFGVDVVEGNETPAIKVEFVQHTNNSTVNITDSTNVIAGNSITGDNNTLTLSGLEKAIESADATPQEKEEAKTLFRKLLEHPLVSALAGGAVGLLGS